MKVSPDILSLTPYRPGKPISEAKRELGLNTVYKLASNECPVNPSNKVVAAIKAHLSEITRYPDAAAFDMVNAYSRFLQVPTNEIAFGNGSNELIDLLIRIYCEPGDAILTSQGAFIAYRISAQAARVKTVETNLLDDGCFDLSAMAEAVKKNPKIRLVFIANPNNPTGTYVDRENLQRFLAACKDREILVVLDEAYAEFVRASNYASGLELRKSFSNVVILRTMSKVYGLAALRVGFAIASAETVDLINRVRNPFNVNSLAQVATLAALDDQEHVRWVKEQTWRGLDLWNATLNRLGLKYFASQANFVLIDCAQDSDPLFNSLLRRGIITRPVKNYGLNTHLRISMGTDEENRAAIAALEAELGR